MNAKHRKIESALQPTLFDLKETPKAAVQSNFERPFTLPGVLLGTSSFTATGWEGSFYPQGMRSREFLSYYAKQFQTVEIDSTFYGTPSASTVAAWNEKTPPDFIFAVKVPQAITHEKILVGCEAASDEFIERMSLLGDKRGPMLLQFPKFDKWTLKSSDELLARLNSFLKRVSDSGCRFAVEIRNHGWIDERFLDALRKYNVSLAWTDTSFVPKPWESKKPLDLITADFAYVRWLGNRKQMETITTTWDRAVVDRSEDLKTWVKFLRDMVTDKRLRKIFAFANNHYAGFGPATIRQFWELWRGEISAMP